MKKLRRVVVVIVVVLIVAAAGAVLLMDSLAKKAVETGGTYALGVDTTVDSISIRLIRGQLKMDGLRVANPEGFKSDHLMESGSFLVELKPASVFLDTVHLPELVLDGLDINIEQTLAGSNVSKILDNLKRFEKKEKDKKEKPKKPGKKIRVDHILIKNVVAHFVLLGGKSVTVKIPRIELKDVSSGNGEGMTPAELIGRIFPAVLASIVAKAEGLVSAELLKDIDSGINEVVEAAGESMKELTDQAGKQIEEAGKAASETVERAKRELEGLFRIGDANKDANSAR